MKSRTRQAFLVVSSVLAVLTTHALAEASDSRIVVEHVQRSIVGDGWQTSSTAGSVTEWRSQLSGQAAYRNQPSKPVQSAQAKSKSVTD